MAMFVSPSSEYTTTKPPKPDIEHKAKRPWWHTYLLSDSHILSPKDDRQRVKIPMPELSPKADQHRKAASVNDADARLRAPKWLASLASPASPVLPTYPPPVRSPTPPGLPSFGTEEALRYSARFPVDSGLANGQSHQRSTHGSAGKGNRVESYGEALRRFFGISSSSAFRPNGRGCTVVRAADGTVVQGRLPHRQSSHGVGAGGRLVDHPFHRRNLSTTQFDSVGENGGAVVHTQPLDTGNYSNMRRKNSLHSGIARPPISRLQISSSNLSPGPNHSAIPPSRATLTHPVSRCESRLACVSQQEATTTPIVGISPIPDPEPPGCSPTRTRSTAEPSIQEGCVMLEAQHGLRLPASRIANSCFRCCLGTRNEQSTATYSNTSSNDTYTTARSRISDDSSGQHSHANNNKKGPVQELGQYCSNMWVSFRTFISSHSYGSSAWLDQTREPF
ncbi:uncharacterized protein BDW43DRAFT_295816 [Aspergillus alliaceus]|uniref:uncharacterized protein n=1 Tax=Petromyces alliaceus TaxID=209559 RepID=UPI0012A5DE47|nr:uncharacterized protein BDW43DRAFT_295816 [Aspergillus alliaceus]KAB8239337.1 hypothetical protein BDW43DRAFT_295816 [Aspergillus alliaceus]